MNLKTELNYNGISISICNDNNENIITKSVKITNKHKQLAQNKANNMVDSFMRIASIERKKEKKKAFFNKHKNN